MRLYIDPALVRLPGPQGELELPAAAARHVQVRRAQPGEALRLFDGAGGEWRAEVLRMGRQDVRVRLLAHDPVAREAPTAVTLLAGMPANERMDWLVEKATEFGAAAIVPVLTERCVLRLAGERAERRRAHWQGVAIAAAEQSGRTRVPAVALPQPLAQALQALDRQTPPAPRPAGEPPAAGGTAAAPRWLLSPQAGAPPALAAAARAGSLSVLSGPEGGLSAEEEALARRHGFVPVALGPRVLRAETAPLAVLAGMLLLTA